MLVIAQLGGDQRPAVDAGAQPQLVTPATSLNQPDGGHLLLHSLSGRQREGRMILTQLRLIEQSSQCIAAEFEQGAAVAMNFSRQGGEKPVDNLGDDLGTFSAEGSKLLGEGGKTGEVGEKQRAVEALAADSSGTGITQMLMGNGRGNKR
ncbi:MAG: hypothetical protein KatS3mg057_2433 [Herpetosiphonaceae bacterium]|nr:MAG: hypothetical protein KatS3mg057_2433 [Herpetosiphonaceae bacterium]